MELELRKLGLSEKEVRVYLAGLELGPNSVQNIAKEAGLSRPTAYEIIKKLEDKKLFLEIKQKNKKLFRAQSPENILGILRTQKREIEEKEREFIRIIATLEAKYSKEEGIRVFKGKESLKNLEETISFSSTPQIILINPKNIPISSKLLKRI
jgi:sugar-specific transcriptional regulator TrmB